MRDGLKKLEEIVKHFGMTAADRFLMICWLIGGIKAKKDKQPYPLLWLSGMSASGKTVAARALWTLFYGEKPFMFDMTEAAMLHVAEKSPFFVLDNWERPTRSMTNMALLTACNATHCRTTETPGVEMKTTLNSLLCVTSIEEPHLPELRARTIQVDLARKNARTEFKDEIDLLSKVNAERDEILKSIDDFLETPGLLDPLTREAMLPELLTLLSSEESAEEIVKAWHEKEAGL